MAPAPSFMSQAVPLLMVLSLFYAFVIRPGRVAEGQRYRAVRRLIGGETVVTAAGMRGTVTAVDHARGEYEVELAEGMRVNLGQKGIAEVRRLPDPDAKVPVDEAARRLAATIGAPLPGLSVIGWAGGAGGADGILVLHRPDRQGAAAKAPGDFMGYPVRVTEAPCIQAPAANGGEAAGGVPAALPA